VFYVGIDIGTGLSRFVIARQEKSQIKRIRQCMMALNFGSMMPGSRFTITAIQRLEKIFGEYRVRINEYRNQTREDYRIRCVATAAFRYAENAQEVIEQLYKKFDIKIEIINPAEEIRLAVLSVQRHIKARSMVIDIGAGSIEIAVVEKNPRAEIIDFISISLGLMNNMVGDEERNKFLTIIQNFVDRYQCSSLPIIATKSGLLNILQNHVGENIKLNMELITRATHELLNMSISQAKKTQYIGKNRIDLIRTGLSWVYEILKILNPCEIILTDFGLKDGLIQSMVNDTI
jgi:exopolyphosphatase/guanosine-5'-triphosphate,3'-diphosphate pyrophosphatase